MSQEAKRIGTEVDQRIRAELLHQDTLPTQDPAVLNCLQAWQTFKQDHPHFVSTISGIQTELTDGEIVGHPDLEITEQDRWGMVDIKTSKAIQPKMWTQVAKYLKLKYPLLLDQSSRPLPTYFLGILRLDKLTGQYEYRELTTLSEIAYEMQVFQAYWTAYQHGQKIREVLRRQLEQEVLDVP